MADRTDWAGPDGLVGAYISKEAEKTLAAYRSQPNLIIEHANHEEDTARGGYARRQLFELVQNGADAPAVRTGSERSRRSVGSEERAHPHQVDADTSVLRRRGTIYRQGWRKSPHVLPSVPQARHL